MAATSNFRPFVLPTESRPELTARALILGAFFGVLFGAVTVYVGLRAGLTVAASIPISVLSISILRAFGKASILENNVVQTTGNAGQSIASGVIFTLPALIFLGFDLESTRIFALALFGGWLGVLFMIPLRRQLIVEEHGTLTYPEGTACADVLMAGERGGSFASRVFLGLGLGSLYTLFQNENLFGLFPGTPNFSPDLGDQHLLKGGAIRADVTAEYLGVGYIIGMRVAAIMFAGGVFSWLVLMPAIYFFGSKLGTPLYPGTVPIHDMSPSQLWSTYVRPMGAGAVACSGLITLLRTAPTILAALSEGIKSIGKNKGSAKKDVSSRPERSGVEGPAVETDNESTPIRTEHDLPWSVVLGGSVLLVILLWFFLQFKPVPGAQVGAFANLAAAFLVVLFGFLFVTVSARIVGIVGSSASPVSGMTIATLMATAAIFLVKGWTAPAFGALAITIGGIVCIAASNAGDTAQDLKTGYIIGATPWKQQLAIMIGVVISVFSIGTTLNAMNKGLEAFQLLPHPITFSLNQLPDGVQNNGNFTRDRISLTNPATSSTTHSELNNTRQLILLNAIGSTTLADGKYLYNPATSQIEVQWTQGIGSEKAAAPQGRLMATVINGILSRKLPWSLVLLGVALVIMVELLGVRSLTLAVGAYLSIGTTLAIFVGGVIRWMVDRAMKHHADLQAEAARAALYDRWKSARALWLTNRSPIATSSVENAELDANYFNATNDYAAFLEANPDLIPFKGFDPKNPEHLDPATGLPVPTCIIATEAFGIEDGEISSGSLYASGLIAAGGIVGLLGVAVRLYESTTDSQMPRFSDHNPLHHDWVSVIMFGLLAFSLYYFARRPLETKA
ncbi:MAG TPA: oligopeptide transporter, OPT family [Edaphobacter sp.]|nr:oligopeptide transporter, OPT family [Edaphobacter sp.]